MNDKTQTIAILEALGYMAEDVEMRGRRGQKRDLYGFADVEALRADSPGVLRPIGLPPRLFVQSCRRLDRLRHYKRLLTGVGDDRRLVDDRTIPLRIRKAIAAGFVVEIWIWLEDGTYCREPISVRMLDRPAETIAALEPIPRPKVIPVTRSR